MLELLLLTVLIGCGDDPPGTEDASLPDAAAPAEWSEEPSLPAAVQEHAGVVHDGRLWIAGGFDAEGEVLEVVRSRDPAGGDWRTEPSLPAPRHHLMLASAGGRLYALGGMETIAFEPVDTAWALEGDEWEAIATLPEPRAAGVAAAIGDDVLVACGQGARELTDVTWRLRDGVWEDRAPIPTPREHAAGFVHEGELWVIGGRAFAIDTAATVVEIYDTIADRWRAGPSVSERRGGHGAAAMDGVAYVAGGELGGGALDDVEILSLEGGDAWERGPSMLHAHHGFALLAAEGRVFAIGGADRPAFGAFDVVESLAH